MSAEQIAAKLGDECQDGHRWKARCPCCSGRLSLWDGQKGRLFVNCWTGCGWAEVLRELRRLDLLTGEPPERPSPEEIAQRKAAEERRRRRRIAQALDFWNDGVPVLDTLADRYLQVERGNDLRSPWLDERTLLGVLRFHPRAWHSPGIYRPALMAKVEHVELGHLAVHLTYLSLDGRKTTLDPPRKVFGPVKGAAVRLGPVQPDRWLIVGEGIESTLSVMQACALPGWAALSAGGIRDVILPPEANMVVIAADNDKNGVGERAARAAAERFIAEGRRVRIYMPPVPGSDWNDVLRGKAPAVAEEVSHAA